MCSAASRRSACGGFIGIRAVVDDGHRLGTMLTQTKGIAEKRMAKGVTKVTCKILSEDRVVISVQLRKSVNEYRRRGSYESKLQKFQSLQ